MKNPYAAKAPQHFWKTAVGEPGLADIRPIPAKRFALGQDDVVATAGSCFAQHVSAHIKTRGQVRFLEAEEIGPGQPPFSALYGNIYTPRQLVQLVAEAYGERQPADIAWRRPDGRFIDALRPSVFADGFPDIEALHAARRAHLAAVRAIMAECTVFVFTLGLTEAWEAVADGTVYPLAPGVMAEPEAANSCVFRNFTYEEARDDLDTFIARLARVNPQARVLLTVSPVPLTATYTDDHVLVATAHSKAILRAVCSAATARHAHVYYFPSYEIISGHHAAGAWFADNLRSVKPEGVAQVMSVFEETYATAPAPKPSTASRLFSDDDENVICDDAEIVKTLGF
jgi:hypothetical protein